MGQAVLSGTTETSLTKLMESLVPTDIQHLAPQQMRYSLILNAQGGIEDDVIISRRDTAAPSLYLVVNATRKQTIFARIQAKINALSLTEEIKFHPLQDQALIALQGPKAATILSQFLGHDLDDMPFMTQKVFGDNKQPLLISRCGYTGEDGFEICLPNADAIPCARALLNHDAVAPIGLGARDSLRLEAGLCLYGQDINQTTTPVEAGLAWAIAKNRRQKGDFPGFGTINQQLAHGTKRQRVGMRPKSAVLARPGTEITDDQGNLIGQITSGGYGPSLEGPCAMGYVNSHAAKIGSAIHLKIRDKLRPAEIVALPFIPANTYRLHPKHPNPSLSQMEKRGAK